MAIRLANAAIMIQPARKILSHVIGYILKIFSEKKIHKLAARIMKQVPLYLRYPVFVHIEETCGVISRAHTATGHGGRDRLHKYLSPF